MLKRMGGWSVWLGLALLMAVPAFAQDEPMPPLKVQPGYEELMEAGLLLKDNKAVDTAQREGATLSQKRAALEDRKAMKALALMRAWLAKAENGLPPSELTVDTAMPWMATSRALTRLMAIEQYVLFADGRNAEAIDQAREGLRFSYAIHGHSLIGWLVSAAMDRIMLVSLGRNLEQMSVRDCNRLMLLAQDWSKTPNFLADVLDQERRVGVAELHKRLDKNGVNGLTELFQENGDVDKNGDLEPQAAAMVAQAEKMSQQELKQAVARAEEQLNALYAKAQNDLKTPYWKREQKKELRGKQISSQNIAGQLSDLMAPMMGTILQRDTMRQTYARMLVCHTAIRRYRWEYGHPPATLKELRVDEMAIDPYTGDLFRYKVDGDGFQLESAGPILQDENGNFDPMRRQPFPLLPAKK